MKDATILVVDDEEDLVESIRFNLQRHHYRVLTAGDAATAIELARTNQLDLILLDIMLPGSSGRDATVALRSDPSTRQIPIIMLTALSSEGDIVLGLQLGADDYVTKPFSMDVLLARVAAVLRRPAPAGSSARVLRAGAMTVNRDRHVVELDGQPITVTLTEFRLLEALIVARGRVLTRDQLVSRVMGPDIMVTDRTIDVHTTSLRRKLGRHRDLVETVRGVGYRFADVWQESAVGC